MPDDKVGKDWVKLMEGEGMARGAKFRTAMEWMVVDKEGEEGRALPELSEIKREGMKRPAFHICLWKKRTR